MFVIWTLFPVYWMVSGSLRTRSDLLATPPKLVSTALTVGNYPELFAQRPAFYEFLFNSVVVTVGSTALAVLLGTAATYGFVNYESRRPWSIPPAHPRVDDALSAAHVTVIPLYVIFDRALCSTRRLALVLAYAAFNIPFVVRMRRAFRRAPGQHRRSRRSRRAHRNSARSSDRVADGAPGADRGTIFTVINAWNELLFADILCEKSGTTSPSHGRSDGLRDSVGAADVAGRCDRPPFCFRVPRPGETAPWVHDGGGPMTTTRHRVQTITSDRRSEHEWYAYATTT